MLEIAALGIVVAVAAIVARAGRPGAVAALAGGAVLALAAAARRPEPVATSPIRASTTLGYVSSSACRACHPSEHASFGRTFHRTMTQIATPDTVRAPFERRAGAVWFENQRIVMTTGSHREQAYWVEREGDLDLVPFVWLLEERALVPRQDAFLQPPDAPPPAIHWGSNCIACHVVAGEPRRDPVTHAFDPRAVDLGVACEACHGPGRAHVERHRDPVERYLKHASNEADPTIVQPRRLSAERSAALCGQCHAYAFPRDEAGWLREGYSRTFRAGDPLDRSRILLDPATLAAPGAPVVDAPLSSLFWPDGSVRVGGREYAGLMQSACFVEGRGERQLTCISCHAMHAGDPAGQIAPARAGDAMCTGCHVPDDHSHHANVECVSCHMPKTSYALLRGVRTHRIERPRVSLDKPNACNLCHLDRSLGWTADWLAKWYAQRSPPLEAHRRDVPAGTYDGLTGDAALRALIADASRDRDLLDVLRSDPYAAVRFIAQRSLARPQTRSSETLEADLVRTLRARRNEDPVTVAE